MSPPFRLRSFLLSCSIYVAAMVVLGYLGAVMGAAGHDPLWLMIVVLILTLPTSALYLGLAFAFFEAATRTDAFGWIMLFAVPVVNAPLVWLLWRFLMKMSAHRGGNLPDT